MQATRGIKDLNSANVVVTNAGEDEERVNALPDDFDPQNLNENGVNSILQNCGED